jgi:hypothetical protein
MPAPLVTTVIAAAFITALASVPVAIAVAVLAILLQFALETWAP